MQTKTRKRYTPQLEGLEERLVPTNYCTRQPKKSDTHCSASPGIAPAPRPATTLRAASPRGPRSGFRRSRAAHPPRQAGRGDDPAIAQGPASASFCRIGR
jgi:hypothetical protein